MLGCHKPQNLLSGGSETGSGDMSSILKPARGLCGIRNEELDLGLLFLLPPLSRSPPPAVSPFYSLLYLGSCQEAASSVAGAVH